MGATPPPPLPVAGDLTGGDITWHFALERWLEHATEGATMMATSSKMGPPAYRGQAVTQAPAQQVGEHRECISGKCTAPQAARQQLTAYGAACAEPRFCIPALQVGYEQNSKLPFDVQELIIKTAAGLEVNPTQCACCQPWVHKRARRPAHPIPDRPRPNTAVYRNPFLQHIDIQGNTAYLLPTWTSAGCHKAVIAAVGMLLRQRAVMRIIVDCSTFCDSPFSTLHDACGDKVTWTFHPPSPVSDDDDGPPGLISDSDSDWDE